MPAPPVPMETTSRITAAVAALAPFFLLGYVAARAACREERLAALLLALPLGLAFGVLGVVWADLAGLGLFPWSLPLAALWAALASAPALLRPRGEAPVKREALGPAAVALAAAVVYLAWFGPRPLPYGNDPSFHTIFAEKALRAGSLPRDWEPFERIKLNFPAGLHGLMAVQSRLSGVPPAHCFDVDLALLVASSAGLVGLLAGALRPSSGWLAASIYAFGANWGGMDYGRWGGITNAFGMCLLLLAVWLLAAEGRGGTWRAVVAGSVFAAIAAAHHHSMLAAGLALAAVAGGLVRTRSLEPRGLVAGAAAALATGLPAWLWYLGRLGGLAATQALDFREELHLFVRPWEPATTLGILPFAGLLGWLLVTRRRGGRALSLAGPWLLVLAAAFAVLRGIYPLEEYLRRGVVTTALSPLRFWTDMVYPASVVSGVFFADAWRRLSRRRSPLKWGVAAFLLLGFAWQAAVGVREQAGEKRWDGTLLEEIAWIRENTPPDALIVTDDVWVAPLAWRETTATPLPTSEERGDQWVRFKREVLRWDSRPLVEWSRTTGRPVYIQVGRLPEHPLVRPCLERGDRVVYRLLASEGDGCGD